MELEVIVGTYEQLILGYSIADKDKDYELVNSFTDHSHVGIVRCVSISEKGILASGSSDEAIKLFNLRKRRELGTLMHHEGSINQVVFHGKDSMLSCSDDGTLGIWKINKWECIRTLKGHKSAVYSVSVHPSGKLALSVSHDKTMRTWNLLTGKCAYINKLKCAADFVQWTPEGDHYFVVSNMTADLYSVETASVVRSLNCGFKIHAIVYIESDLVAIAGDKGIVQFYTIRAGEKVFEFSTDTIRIKGMQLCGTGADKNMLITGSSDGFIKIWNLKQSKESWTVDLLASADTKFRIISLAVHMRPKSSTNPDSKSKAEEELSELQSDGDLDSNASEDSDNEMSGNSENSDSGDEGELDSDILGEFEEMDDDSSVENDRSSEENVSKANSTKHKHSPKSPKSSAAKSPKRKTNRNKTSTVEQSAKSKSTPLKKKNNTELTESIQSEKTQLSKKQKKKLKRRAKLAAKKAEKHQNKVKSTPPAIAGKKRKQENIKDGKKKKRKQ